MTLLCIGDIFIFCPPWPIWFFQKITCRVYSETQANKNPRKGPGMLTKHPNHHHHQLRSRQTGREGDPPPPTHSSFILPAADILNKFLTTHNLLWRFSKVKGWSEWESWEKFCFRSNAGIILKTCSEWSKAFGWNTKAIFPSWTISICPRAAFVTRGDGLPQALLTGTGNHVFNSSPNLIL